MKNRPLVLAFVVAVCVHAIAGLSLSLFLGTRNPRDVPQVAVSLDLAETDLRDSATDSGSQGAKSEGLLPASDQIAPGTDETRASVAGLTPRTDQTAGETADVAAIPGKSLGEGPMPTTGQAIERSGAQGPGQPFRAGDEPPYLIDTPPKFIEKGPISFPKDVHTLTERTSIIVYLSLSARAEILSIDAVAKGVDELKVEVIKMILKSKFSPAYVGRMPVPCVAKCVVTIVLKQVD